MTAIPFPLPTTYGNLNGLSAAGRDATWARRQTGWTLAGLSFARTRSVILNAVTPVCGMQGPCFSELDARQATVAFARYDEGPDAKVLNRANLATC